MGQDAHACVSLCGGWVSRCFRVCMCGWGKGAGSCECNSYGEGRDGFTAFGVSIVARALQPVPVRCLVQQMQSEEPPGRRILRANVGLALRVLIPEELEKADTSVYDDPFLSLPLTLAQSLVSISIYLSIYLCVCVCVCIHAGVHIYASMHVRTYIHTYVHTYIHTYIHFWHSHSTKSGEVNGKTQTTPGSSEAVARHDLVPLCGNRSVQDRTIFKTQQGYPTQLLRHYIHMRSSRPQFTVTGIYTTRFQTSISKHCDQKTVSRQLSSNPKP